VPGKTIFLVIGYTVTTVSHTVIDMVQFNEHLAKPSYLLCYWVYSSDNFACSHRNGTLYSITQNILKLIQYTHQIFAQTLHTRECVA